MNETTTFLFIDIFHFGYDVMSIVYQKFI